MLPGAIRSAPLWPTRRTRHRWHPAHQYVMRLSSPCPRLADRRAAARARPAGLAVDHAVAVLHAVERGLLHAAGACARTISSASSSETVARRRATGRRPRRSSPRTSTCCRCPAIVRWSSSASPIARVGSSSRRRRRKRRSSSCGARMSGPSSARRRSKRVRDAVMQLEHGAVELHDLAALGAQHEPRAARARAASAGRRGRCPTSRSCAGASGSRARPRSARTGACRGRRRRSRRGRRASSGQRSPRSRGLGCAICGHEPLDERADAARGEVDRVALGHRLESA